MECNAMFTVNQTHIEIHFEDLPDSDSVVCCDSKNVIMRRNGTELPAAGQLRGIISPDAMLISGGMLDGIPCWGVQHDLAAAADNRDLTVMECRTAFLQPTEDIMNAISRCREIAVWRNAHRLCGSCGKELAFSKHDLALQCQCGTRYYPQIAPAVIVAVTRNGGKELLLAHNRRFNGNVYSLIAGFVEAGESVEQAVKREIFEETNIKVRNVKYISSQPWPFPNSLMLGLHAEYESGEINPNDGELSDIQWFTRENMPEIPAPGSIALKIIWHFINGKLQ